jgi:hypothetical protein
MSVGNRWGAGSRCTEPLKEVPSASHKTDLGGYGRVRKGRDPPEHGVPSVPLALLPRGGASWYSHSWVSRSSWVGSLG